MASLAHQKAELESLILDIANKCIPKIDLLLTVPGINDGFTAIRIIAEIGVDMSIEQFVVCIFLEKYTSTLHKNFKIRQYTSPLLNVIRRSSKTSNPKLHGIFLALIDYRKFETEKL